MKLVKVGSIVEVEYEGRLKEGILFDTNNEKLAKEENIWNPDRKYELLKFKVGEGQVIKGLDEGVIEMMEGDEKIIKISPEDGYGYKSDNFVREVDKKFFKGGDVKEGTVVLLKINNEERPAFVVKAYEDKCLLDFNHPLAGFDLIFKVKMLKVF